MSSNECLVRREKNPSRCQTSQASRGIHYINAGYGKCLFAEYAQFLDKTKTLRDGQQVKALHNASTVTSRASSEYFNEAQLVKWDRRRFEVCVTTLELSRLFVEPICDLDLTFAPGLSRTRALIDREACLHENM